nr:hypothetical protein [Mycoplasmopsis bovis]
MKTQTNKNLGKDKIPGKYKHLRKQNTWGIKTPEETIPKGLITNA